MTEKTVDIEKIHDVVLNNIKKDFNNVEIFDVDVVRDIDFDGDEVLRITVVFHGTPKDLLTDSVSGAARHIRPKLNEIGERAFPIFSFISKKELEAGGGAAA